MTTPAASPVPGVSRRSADARVRERDDESKPGPSRKTVMPLVLGILSAVLVIGGFGFGVYLPNLHNGLIAMAFAAVGIFVVRRRPENREGWLFIATGVAHAVMFFGRQYGFFAETHEGASLPALEWLTWMGVWPLALVLVLTAVTLMSFPEGRLPSPRWRVVATVMGAAGVLVALASALWPIEYVDNSLSIPHPINTGGFDTAQTLWGLFGPPLYLGFQLAWVACVVTRLRRATGDEARQLKWFVYAVGMGAVAMAVGFVLFDSPTLGVLAVPIVPIAAGAAIVQYRLYDIDLVINKTLVLGIMAGVITAGYAGVVVGIGTLVGVSASNLALPLAATALVAMVFEPARRRAQGWADRLVYGQRLTPYDALARLSTQLTLGGHQAEVYEGLASTLADGVGAAEVALWVGSRDELLRVASWPPRDGPDSRPTGPLDLASLGDDGRAHVRPIVHQGTLRGAVTLTKARGEVLSPSEDRLLRDLVAQAGLVIDNVGLGAELQERLQQISVQAAELRAAAKRIVAAQDEGRRRIERDLHDGAQQRLVTLALSLQAVSERAASLHDDEFAASVEEARLQLTDALAELREMARGIHPAILTEQGLEAALSFLAERAPVPVQVDTRLDRRLAPEVEATAYFLVSEALTNAAKHSGASRITAGGRLEDGRLLIEVTDNGRGGADPDRGTGLQGLTDRLATLNGRLTVDSPVGGGTRLRAEIPCE